MESNNPMLRGSILDRVETTDGAMTMQGFINRLGILLTLLLVAGGLTWSTASHDAEAAGALLVGGCVIGLVLALVTAFVPKASPFTSPIYAIAEGVALGALSAVLERRYPGIAISAALLTVSTVFGM